MSRHDPSNANCDKNAYPGADGVLCTCDVDPADDRPAPSTVMPAPGDHPAVSTAGDVVLRGGHAAAYRELQAAARELDTARGIYQAAELRAKVALDRFHAEMMRGVKR